VRQRAQARAEQHHARRFTHDAGGQEYGHQTTAWILPGVAGEVLTTEQDANSASDSPGACHQGIPARSVGESHDSACVRADFGHNPSPAARQTRPRPHTLGCRNHCSIPGVAQGATLRATQGAIPGADPGATPWTIYGATLRTIPGIARWVADWVALWTAERAIQGATRGATPWAARGLGRP